MKFVSCLYLTFAVLATSVSWAQEKVITPRQALALPVEDIASGGVQTVRGVVTFVSGIASNRLVITSEEHPSWQGLTVRHEADGPLPHPGDLVQVRGALADDAEGRFLAAQTLDVVRCETLPDPSVAKQADFRRGILTGRRVALIGTVREIRLARGESGPVSEVKLFLEDYTVITRIAGSVEAERLLGAPVRMTGLACSRLNHEGDLVDAWLEVAGAEDIVFLEREPQHPRALLWPMVCAGACLLAVALVLFVLWLRGLRERHAMVVVAAERRRMAADLHDTIEQHLAGANLIAAGVSQLDDTPADVREAMQTLTALLANAKAEVRSAVLNLRSAGETEKSLAVRIGEMAQALAKTGVKTRKLLRGLPAELPEGVYQDIVLIVREATTNAVKHGKATEIIFTADPYGKDGWVLRVLNNGAPFEVDQALGPETGHYGLSGMQERALRNHLAISWGRDGKWTYVQLQSEERT